MVNTPFLTQQKIHINYPFNFFANAARVVGEMAGKSVPAEVIDEERRNSKEYKAINMTMKFPMLETPEGNLNETIAIIKYLAHGHAVLGANAVEAAKVDQWMYWAMTSALPAQMPAIHAIHGWGEINQKTYNESTTNTKAMAKTLNGVLTGDWLVGNSCTAADIVCATYFMISRQTFLDGGFCKAMPKFAAWMDRVFALPAYRKVAGHVKFAAKAVKPQIKAEEKKVEAKPAAAPKPKKDVDEDGNPVEEKKINPLDALPETSFDLFNFKTFFVNCKDKKGEGIDEMLKIFDRKGWQFWYLQYEKYGTEGQVLYKTENLAKGFLQRFDSFRKYAFARHCVLGDEPNLEIWGVWLFRGLETPQEAIDHPQYEYYQKRKLDVDNAEDLNIIREFWGGSPDGTVMGKTVQSISWHK